MQLFDWCKTESVAKDRLLTFYRLSDSIADWLKGLFVLFAGHLVKPVSDLLRQTNVTKTGGSLLSLSHVWLQTVYESKVSKMKCLD